MIGQVISHYKILDKLGEGGMGVVYKAHDTELDRMVALKFLPNYLTSDAAEKERFYHEARAASALNHPNITTIYEIKEFENQLYLAMEFVEGKTLKRLIEHETLSMKKVLDIAIQICDGLAAAHEKGIVHRDIKSDNIMLTSKAQIKIMDFGLAKIKGASKLTKAGSTLGTAAYMSPEQAQGEEVDSRSDIFSFGVVLYELLTTKLPFRGEHQAALMYSLMNEDPQLVARFNDKVSPELERVVYKALAKDRDERYQHIDDMLADLRRERKNFEYARTGYIRATATAQQVTAVQPKSKLSKYVISFAVVLLAVIGIVLWQLMKPSAEISQNMVFKPLQLPFTTIWYPGLSSDGNWIAFPATDANNVSEIYYMHASGGEPKKLTNDSLWKFVADISPDGSQIVYARGSSRRELSFPLQIFTISTLGGQSKKISDGGNAPRWSPDGKTIAYIARGSLGGIALWLMNADGSNKRMVLEDSLGQRVSLAWSPEAKSIAWLRTFIGSSGMYQEVIIHDLETGKERPLTNYKKNIDEVYWMPQGEILFSSNREGPSNLWAIPSDGGTPTQITRGPGPDLGVKASRDGKKVLYMQQAAYGSIMVADLNGLNARQVTPDDHSVFGPSFSPDGKQIAFLVNDPDPIKPLAYFYLVDRDGRNRRQLTTEGENIENFVWSPDGRKIAYTIHVNVEIDSAHQIAIIDVGDPAQKSFVGNGRVIQWLNDRTSLNILSNQASWRVSIQGNIRERMYEDSMVVLQSPDGLKLAIYDSRVGKTGLSIKPKDMPIKKLIETTLDQGANGIFQWFPDSKRLVVSKDGELWMISIETRKMQRYSWKNTEAVAFTDIGPDGKQTVYVKQRMNAKLILIDNFH